MKLQRTTTAPAETVLQAIQNHVNKKFPKVETKRDNNTITLSKKVLWQKQQATFTVENNHLEAEGETLESQKWIHHTIGAIDNHIHDHGWKEAATTHNTISTKNNLASRNRIIEELAQDETVKIAVSGLTLKKRVILTVTDKRAILTSDSPLGTKTSTQTIPLDKISSVKSGSGTTKGYVEIVTSNETIKVDDVLRQEVEALAGVLSR